MSSKY